MKITFNGHDERVPSIEALGEALDRFAEEHRFELWIAIEDGPSLTMLRNGDHAWLMYLRDPGDSGFVSRGADGGEASIAYALANGQVDDYPLGWCIDIETCFKAIAYFFVNDGLRYDHVDWQDG